MIQKHYFGLTRKGNILFKSILIIATTPCPRYELEFRQSWVVASETTELLNVIIVDGTVVWTGALVKCIALEFIRVIPWFTVAYLKIKITITYWISQLNNINNILMPGCVSI